MFTYGPNMTLEWVLLLAKQAAKNQRADIEFTFNDVCFTITSESNLSLAFCAFFSASAGDVVGPCVLPDGRKTAFAARKLQWDSMSRTDRIIVLRAFNWLQDK